MLRVRVPSLSPFFFAANRGKSRALPVVGSQSRTKVRSFMPPLAKRDISSRFAAKKQRLRLHVFRDTLRVFADGGGNSELRFACSGGGWESLNYASRVLEGDGRV